MQRALICHLRDQEINVAWRLIAIWSLSLVTCAVIQVRWPHLRLSIPIGASFYLLAWGYLIFKALRWKLALFVFDNVKREEPTDATS